MILIGRDGSPDFVKITFRWGAIYTVLSRIFLETEGCTKVLEKKYMKIMVAKNPIPVNLS